MITDSVDSEKESLTRSIKHVKYGSTANHKPNERFISHIVLSTDTLQGLALKYEVTMEQIKRANKLWSNDNLTLRSRQILSIPLPIVGPIQSPLYSSSTESSASASPINKHTHRVRSHDTSSRASKSLESDEIALFDDDDDDIEHENECTLTNGNQQSKLKNGFTANPQLMPVSSHESNDNKDLSLHQAEDGESEESIADFLIRIDSSIAKTKDNVKHMQQNRISSTHSDDDLCRYHQPHRSGLRRHHSSSLSRPNSSHNSLTDIHSDKSQPYVMMTHGRKIKSSLKRLEKTQDELFEL